MKPALPDLMAITGPAGDTDDFAGRLERALERVLAQGPGAVVFRARELPDPLWSQRLERARQLCLCAEVPLIVATTPARAVAGLGLHLSAADLLACRHRPDTGEALLGASCHSADELRAAHRLGCDYAFLSPILPSDKSQEAGICPLGLTGLADAIEDIPLAIYALGGLSVDDLPSIRAAGARGIAGISWCWPADRV